MLRTISMLCVAAIIGVAFATSTTCGIGLFNGTYLINKLTDNPDEEQKAIFELERMKQDAIPYIVGHLGDTRPLASPEFLLLNPPEVKFEKYAHLGAANIHGALVFILHWSVRSELPRPPLELAAPISESKQQWVSWCHQQYPRYASACDGL